MNAGPNAAPATGVPDSGGSRSDSAGHPGIWLFVATFLVHNPLLWTDHILWDEVSFEKMGHTGDLSGKLASLAAQGIASVYDYYVAFALLPDPTRALRIAALLSIWITSWVLFSALSRFGRLPRRESLFAALLFIVYPAYQMYDNAGAAIYVICLALFALGARCYLSGVGGVPDRHRFWFVAAAGFWVLSFMQQWLLPYYYAFFAAVALARPLAEWRRRFASAPDRWSLLRIHAIFLILPPAFYFLQRRLFPLDHYFAGYSVPVYDWQRNLHDAGRAAQSSLLTPFWRVLELPAWVLCAAAPVVGAACFAPRKGSTGGPLPRPGLAGTSPGRLVLAGLVLLAAGLYPFVLVGKVPAAGGPGTRFAILVAPSLGVIAAALFSFGARIRLDILRRSTAGIGLALLAAFAFQDVRAYADWQACAIKDHALAVALRKRTPPAGVDFFVITGSHLEHTYGREFYDWGRILHDAWGGYDRIAVPIGNWRPVERHDYTPLGINRGLIANFALWMGYGQPGPPDRWCEMEFQTRPEFDFSKSGVWSVVGADILHRLGLCAQTRDEWLAGFVTRVSISEPHDYAFSYPLLDPVHFQWGDEPASWRPAARSLPTEHPLISEFKADPDIVGKFSVKPEGGKGFAIRCDALPAGGTAGMLYLRMVFRPSALPHGTPPRAFGVSCDFAASAGAPRPLLVLITLPRMENPGYSRIPGIDSIEVWTTDTPSHAILIWKPDVVGQVLDIRGMLAGFTMPFLAPGSKTAELRP